MATTTITKAALIKEVRIVLDQNESNNPLASTFSDPDQLQTDDIIEECLQFAIDRVLALAPIDLIADWVKVVKKNAQLRSKNMVGKYGKRIAIDFDFIKIISVACESWEQAVTDIHNITEPIYKQMKSQFAGVRGNTDRPYVFLLYNPSEEGPTEDDPSKTKADKLIEIYDTAEKGGVYVAYVPKITVSDSMEIPDLIHQAIVYTTANLYYVTLGQSDMAKMMADEAVESMKLQKVEES